MSGIIPSFFVPWERFTHLPTLRTLQQLAVFFPFASLSSLNSYSTSLSTTHSYPTLF